MLLLYCEKALRSTVHGGCCCALQTSWLARETSSAWSRSSWIPRSPNSLDSKRLHARRGVPSVARAVCVRLVHAAAIISHHSPATPLCVCLSVVVRSSSTVLHCSLSTGRHSCCAVDSWICRCCSHTISTTATQPSVLQHRPTHSTQDFVHRRLTCFSTREAAQLYDRSKRAHLRSAPYSQKYTRGRGCRLETWKL